MRQVPATEASRNLADLADGVDHRVERNAVVPRGRVVAQLEPAREATGADAKALLRRHSIDRAWTSQMASIRAELVAEKRF